MPDEDEVTITKVSDTQLKRTTKPAAIIDYIEEHNLLEEKTALQS